MARMILKKKKNTGKSNNKNFSKSQKNTFEVSSAICDHLPQVFKFCKTWELLRRCVSIIQLNCGLQTATLPNKKLITKKKMVPTRKHSHFWAVFKCFHLNSRKQEFCGVKASSILAFSQNFRCWYASLCVQTMCPN